MAFAYSDMLETIKNKQWALADIDWNAPGAELITDPDQEDPEGGDLGRKLDVDKDI